jgi:hypothetical protein
MRSTHTLAGMALRARSLVAALTLATLTIVLAPSAEAGDAGFASIAEAPRATCIPPSECCKACNQRRACGDGCISESTKCKKHHGCACNLEEMCASGPGDP